MRRKILIIDIVLLILATILIVSTKSPEAVRGLEVTASTYNTVSLSWDSADNATVYHIYRTADGENYEYRGSVNTTEYEDDGLTTGTEYSYTVCPANGIRRAEQSEPVTATPSLETPVIKGNVKKGEVRLKITGVEGAEGYKVYRNGEGIKVLTAEELEYVDTTAKPDTKYNYVVKAFRGKAVSEPSKKLKLKLMSAGEMSASITLDTLTLTWEGSDYSTYKLYSGDTLLTETSDCSYEMDAEPGDYVFKLIGFKDNKQSPESVYKYRISEEDMDNSGAIDAACEWAEEIAADDSFTYGTGERAHRCGCYFCGTNLSIKGKEKENGHSYEKTYCCNPFVHACFAHGAGDETMLAACQSGHSIGMTESSYTRYGCWEKVGKPDMSNLKKGDVLVANPNRGNSDSNHVMLYIGDGQIAHAARSGWDDDSIRVNKLTSGNYKRCDFVMRYTGNGSGKMLKVTEIVETAEKPEKPEKQQAPSGNQTAKQ